MKIQHPKKRLLDKQSPNRTPWLFSLEVKDLIRPIILKRIRILQMSVLLVAVLSTGYLIWDNVFRAPTGTELLDDMVNATGGMDAWNNVHSGKFTRIENVYDKTGRQVSHHIETFFFRRTDDGIQFMVKALDDEGHEVVISRDERGFWATRDAVFVDPKSTSDDLGMMCDSEFCEPDCAAMMAFYRFSMPFKLKDPGVILGVGGAAKDMPLMLNVSFSPEVGRDRWKFAVDSKTKLIQKVEYYNKSDMGAYRPEETYWSDYKMVDGIMLSHKWTKYWPNGKVMDEYIYSDVSFDHQMEVNFFDRSKMPDQARL